MLIPRFFSQSLIKKKIDWYEKNPRSLRFYENSQIAGKYIYIFSAILDFPEILEFSKDQSISKNLS